jgi:N-methylhydantoinase A
VDPTVTDADVALGYLDPLYFLGGAMKLYPQRALAAIGEHIAPKLGDVAAVEAAYGVHELANEDMASAARLHMAERGEDAAMMTMIAYGGAGPVHAYGLAKKLGAKTVIVPPAAGVMSALGMLVEDLAIDRVRTHRGALAVVVPAEVDAIYAEMAAEAARLLKCAPVALRLARVADMRYRGQGYNVRVPVEDGVADLAAMRSHFEAEYQRRYGRVYADVEIELVNLRLMASLPARRAYVPPRLPPARGGVSQATKGGRRAWFGAAGFVDCPVFDRYRLAAGHAHEGPAFVEERETTTVIGPGGGFRVNEYGMIVVRVA